jgi:uncharacterized protein YfbU (UPF0304 family)
MKLSRVERIILVNQFTILNKLSPGSYDAELQALYGNFELELDSMFQGISDKSVSMEICRDVRAILAMYSYLRASYDKLPDNSEIGKLDVTFPGFDQDTEEDQWCLANYLFGLNQQYTNVKPAHLNSAVPYLPRYRRMLERYEKYKHGRGLENQWLSVGEISDVLDAFNPTENQ